MPTPIDDVLEDLVAEYDHLESVLESLTPTQWTAASAAPGWTVADTMLHLALTEEGVVSSLAWPEATWTTRDRPLDEVIDIQVRDHAAPPPEVFERWRSARRESVAALASADPDVAVRWAAAPLRPRTLATTRLAEHWAHALDIVEPLGLVYHDTDRLRHIAWLGHATLPYAMRIAGLEPVAVHCSLTTPSGELHTFGPADAATTIRGSMGQFCRVGARRLDPADSGLDTTGPEGAAVLGVLRNYAA